MSLLSDKYKKTYTGNGVSTVFPYDFKITDASEMEVVVYNSTLGTETILTTGYTVDGVGVAGGGNVTLDDAASSPVGTDLILRRNMDFTQGSDWEQNGGFSTDVLEARLDHAYMCLLQLKELTDRMIVQDPTQTTQETISSQALASTLDAIAAAASAEAAQAAAEAARDIAVAAAGSMTLASQAEAIAGANNVAYMSSLRVKQSIKANKTIVGTVAIAAGHLAIDASLYDVVNVSVNAAFELDLPTNGADLDRLEIRLTQDGTGNHAITLPAGILIASELATDGIVLSTAANAIDKLGISYNGSAWMIDAFSTDYAEEA